MLTIPNQISMKNLLFIPVLVVLLSNCQPKPDAASVLAGGRWIDLTWDFAHSTNYWPTNLKFTHDTVFYGINSKGYFYSSFWFAAEEHGGTHFDAPVHFSQGGRTIEQIPVEELTGPAVVIDVTVKAAENRDYLVSPADFTGWETEHGRIPDRSIVLVRTGFGKFWDDPEKYTGTTKPGAEGVAELHFPGLDPEAAKWLLKERSIKAFGIDTPSIDYGQSTDFMTHRILLGGNITAYENIAHLEELPATGAYLVAAPMKIRGGSGAPLRLMAFMPGE